MFSRYPTLERFGGVHNMRRSLLLLITFGALTFLSSCVDVTLYDNGTGEPVILFPNSVYNGFWIGNCQDSEGNRFGVEAIAWSFRHMILFPYPEVNFDLWAGSYECRLRPTFFMQEPGYSACITIDAGKKHVEAPACIIRGGDYPWKCRCFCDIEGTCPH